MSRFLLLGIIFNTIQPAFNNLQLELTWMTEFQKNKAHFWFSMI